MSVAVSAVLNFAWLLLVWLIAWRLKRIADALVRLNDGRDDFYREILATLSDAKTSGEHLASGTDATPEKGGWCAVCHRAIGGIACFEVGPLARQQWLDHHAFLSDQGRRDGMGEVAAETYATDRMYVLFGKPGTDAPEEDV